MSDQYSITLIDEFRRGQGETGCVEFKKDYANPTMIGKYISAIANAATLSDQPFGYVVWGIRDSDQVIIGTDFEPSSVKTAKQPLEFWLARRLSPDIAFSFESVNHPAGRIVLLKIPAASISPVEFEHTAYIRIGSATPRLSDYPDRQRAFWSKLQSFQWETAVAAKFITADEVLARIDYVKYFELTDQRLPDNREGIFERLVDDRLILRNAGECWDITNVGAILFAKRLDDFGSEIARRAVRFTFYTGNGRDDAVAFREDWPSGYAAGFTALVSYINRLLPIREEIGEAFRTETRMFPEVAIRELIANALIHQDMTLTGAGPTIELFPNRIEIANPGTPLVKPDRLIDASPRSRNEVVATLMRRMSLCEERGTGIDKVVSAIERHHSPPPDFRIEPEPGATRAILFAPRRFAEMTADERVRACYQHAVLKYLRGESMRNASLRERFGVESRNSAQVSKVISAAIERGWVHPVNPDRPRSGYVPFWA